MEKKDLKPAGVFHYFEEICQVPRPSKKEEKIIAFLKAFGEKHKLETLSLLLEKHSIQVNQRLKSLPLRAWKTERPLCYSRM